MGAKDWEIGGKAGIWGPQAVPQIPQGVLSGRPRKGARSLSTRCRKWVSWRWQEGLGPEPSLLARAVCPPRVLPRVLLTPHHRHRASGWLLSPGPAPTPPWGPWSRFSGPAPPSPKPAARRTACAPFPCPRHLSKSSCHLLGTCGPMGIAGRLPSLPLFPLCSLLALSSHCLSHHLRRTTPPLLVSELCPERQRQHLPRVLAGREAHARVHVTVPHEEPRSLPGTFSPLRDCPSLTPAQSEQRPDFLLSPPPLCRTQSVSTADISSCIFSPSWQPFCRRDRGGFGDIRADQTKVCAVGWAATTSFIWFALGQDA